MQEGGGAFPVPGWNAHRFPQPPLRPPLYDMKDVPKCQKDLDGSIVYELTERKQFLECMAEMVLLCNEAARRCTGGVLGCASKPLSLEYQADRLDIDDPCFGYVVRTKDGKMQGFVSVTTFTNWQSSFRWDSHHHMAFFHSHGQSETDKVDWEASLSKRLQSTVKRGDPHEEGIVWPRIAEISLLGALGCGKTMLKLIIEDLQHRKASGLANYDYIVLQATDNSIPFYESLGFIRVGAVSSRIKPQEAIAGDNAQGTEEIVESSEAPKNGQTVVAANTPTLQEYDKAKGIVSSPYFEYVVKKAGEQTSAIAKKFSVNVWDLVFLNQDPYGDIGPNSRMRKGSPLRIPMLDDGCGTTDDQPKAFEPARWHSAKDDETPHKIAKQYGIPVYKLVRANQAHFEDLQASSRLMEGTQLRISHLDAEPDDLMPYCHWSFPDDDMDAAPESGEPSYMMALPLDRVSKRNNRRPFLESLKARKVPWEPAPLLMEAETNRGSRKRTRNLPPPPPRPLKAPTGFDVFAQQQQEGDPDGSDMKSDADLKVYWTKLNTKKKLHYNQIADHLTKNYRQRLAEYETAYMAWEVECQQISESSSSSSADKFFSKVVKLSGDVLPRGSELYKYWFVLTYIPDLKWVRLAPMTPDGVFGPQGNKVKKRSEGRTRWKLAGEIEAGEIDMSTRFCTVVKATTMKRTDDADKEEWDIWGDLAEKHNSNDEQDGDKLNKTNRSNAQNGDDDGDFERDENDDDEEEDEEEPRRSRSCKRKASEIESDVQPRVRRSATKPLCASTAVRKLGDGGPRPKQRLQRKITTRRSATKPVGGPGKIRPTRMVRTVGAAYRDEPLIDVVEEKIPYRRPKKRQKKEETGDKHQRPVVDAPRPTRVRTKVISYQDTLSKSPRTARKVRNAGGLPGVLQK